MRILQEYDRDALNAYVQSEPEMNLFLIGDMENYGVNSEVVNFYLHEERNRWDFVILRFYHNFILYSPYEDYNAGEAFRFLSAQEPECISGKTVLLQKIAAQFPQREMESTFMSRCDRVEREGNAPEKLEIRSMTSEDVPEAIDLLCSIKEFEKTYEKNQKSEHIRRMREELGQGAKQMMGGYTDGRLVTVAGTSAENLQSAMIVGVATDVGERGKGYASAVVSALCKNCFNRGKKFLCLFYDNPAAGRIYNRIGFRELGQYGILR